MSSDVEVSTGETLAIVSGGGSTIFLTVNAGVTLTVDSGGTLTTENSGLDSFGIFNIGTLINSGTVTAENTGVHSVGIDDFGTFTNSGTVTIDNTNGYGIDKEVSGTIATICPGTMTIIAPGTILGFTLPVTGLCVSTKVCDQTTSTCATTGLLKGTLGDSFYDTTTLHWTDTPVPEGTVTYHFYSGGTCAAVDEITGKGWPDVVTLTSTGSVPNSTEVTPTKPGTYSFMAVYSGYVYPTGFSYPPSSSTCTSASLESFIVTSVYPIGVLGVLAPLGALILFASLSKRRTRASDVK